MGLLNELGELVVLFGVRPTKATGNLDCSRELAERLGLGAVGAGLFVHDVGEVRVASMDRLR